MPGSEQAENCDTTVVTHEVAPLFTVLQFSAAVPIMLLVLYELYVHQPHPFPFNPHAFNSKSTTRVATAPPKGDGPVVNKLV